MVTLSTPEKKVDIYSLPSPGIPVLTGMKELENLDVILGCRGGTSVVEGRPVTFTRTAKRHMVMDYLKHVFAQHAEPPIPRQVQFPRSSEAVNQESWMLELSWSHEFISDEPSDFPEECFAYSPSTFSPQGDQASIQDLAQHLGVSVAVVQHLHGGEVFSGSSTRTSPIYSAETSSQHGILLGGQRGTSSGDPGDVGGGTGESQCGQSKGESQG